MGNVQTVAMMNVMKGYVRPWACHLTYATGYLCMHDACMLWSHRIWNLAALSEQEQEIKAGTWVYGMIHLGYIGIG